MTLSLQVHEIEGNRKRDDTFEIGSDKFACFVQNLIPVIPYTAAVLTYLVVFLTCSNCLMGV